jgi:hypothetical protein
MRQKPINRIDSHAAAQHRRRLDARRHHHSLHPQLG